MPSFVVADRVRETSTTQGTGTIDLSGSTSGHQSFVEAIGTGNSTYYGISDGTNWEVGIGTVTSGSPNTLSRNTVIASSNADALVNFPAGTKDVFCVAPARSVMHDPSLVTATASVTLATFNDRLMYATAAAVISLGSASLVSGAVGTILNDSSASVLVSSPGALSGLFASDTRLAAGEAKQFLSFNGDWHIVGEKKWTRGALANPTAVTSVLTATGTSVSLGSAVYDTEGFFPSFPATAAIVPRGVNHIIAVANCEFENVTGSTPRRLDIVRNGALEVGWPSMVVANASASVCRLNVFAKVSVVAGDRIAMLARHEHGSTIDVNTGNSTYLQLEVLD